MKAHLKITILGCGTSNGIPILACECSVCLSDNPLNKRTRSSVLITRLDHSKNIVIDTSPDFRSQMLNSGVKSLEHVLYTHTHADHCHGFDDLRVFYFKHKKHVNCWLSEEHLLEFQKRFSYAFQERHFMDNKPQVQTRSFHSGKPFEVEGLMVHPVLVPHGLEKTTAFRIGSFVYATDFKTIPEDTISSWQGKIHTMIASGVGFKEQYATHSSVAETVRLFQRLGVQRGIITHLSHEVDYGRDAALLPPHVCFAHDGMSLELEIDNV